MFKVKLGLIACGVLLLTGCTPVSSPSQTTLPVGPATLAPAYEPVHILTQSHGVPNIPGGNGQIGWLDGKKQIALTTYGSGSCPQIPVLEMVANPHALALQFKKYPGACTTDSRSTTVTFATPAGLDVTQPIRVSLLPTYPGDEIPQITLNPKAVLSR